jgi:predicted RNA-binding protein with PUA-like domain
MTTQYWLVKSEPEAYAWTDLVRDKHASWTGVRNFQARIHLKAMRPGDRVFFYESVTTKAVVGIAEVVKAAFPDKTADEPGWVAVELKAVEPLAPRHTRENKIRTSPQQNSPRDQQPPLGDAALSRGVQTHR